MDDHIIKKNKLGGYPHKEYSNNIHSIIDNIDNIVYLSEENGWIDKNGQQVSIGYWNKNSRIATINNDIQSRGKLFVIEVDNATIDGNGAVIGESEIGISIVGCNNINLKNLVIENTSVAVYIEFSHSISIEYMTLNENEQAISIYRSSELIVKNNLIDSSKYSAVGIFVFDSGKVCIKNNSINLKILNAIPEDSEYSYSGIISENSTSQYIVNNEIQIIGSNCEVSNLEGYCISGYCINMYSTHDTLIKLNNLYIRNNNFNISNCNISELNFASFYLDSDNVKVDVEENNIVLEDNNFNVICNMGGAGLYGVLASLKNDSNQIKNNLISIKNNIYSLSSNLENSKYICFMAILLDSYNSYNDINSNNIELKDNTISFEENNTKAVNLVSGLYLNMENCTNNIINNDIKINNNNITKGKLIIVNLSLIYFYYNNICNTIRENNLSDSQGNAITLVSKNDLTEIIKNNINNSRLYGILLAKLDEKITTNTSLINDNNINNSGRYGIYIVKGNYYNSIKSNSFPKDCKKNIYDENSLRVNTYYHNK